MSSRKDISHDTRSVGQAIRELLNTYHLDTRFDETRVVTSWERLVGKPIARRTRKVWLKENVLYAEFDTSSMKQDFQIHKNQILLLFSKEFGEGVVRDIIVL